MSRGTEKHSKILCDGNEVSWVPKWVDDECPECGHVTGRCDTAEPEFHAPVLKPDKMVCSRCGIRFPRYTEIVTRALSKIADATVRNIEEQKRICGFYRGTQW